jgi:hypothetical protein
MKKIILIILIISFGYSGEYFYNDGKKVYVTLVKSDISRYHNSGIASNIKYYTTKSGVTLGVNNDIIVKCKKNKNCKQKLLEYDIETIREISKNYYLLHLHDNSRIFTMSREIYEESYIELSHPDFEIKYTAY